MTTEELKVIITAQTAGLNKQIKEVQAQLGKLEKSTEKSCSKINSSFKNIFKGVSFVLILRQLNLVMNKAINMASALEEVQNVVDVAFGSMSAEVEAFAKTAIKSYGMSELTAKKMASTFMAMSNGMGIVAKDGKNMSLQLTALAGDMASFYNVEQSIAQTALSSVFTGETESLKRFGIVLTEANLQAFALSQGIKKNYSAMSQAEKVILRYNYVLKATAQAQGDFARTSGSWANQMRILKEQWSQLLGILGNGLTQVLTPIIKALNSMLSSLISVGNAIAKVFGGKLTNKMETNIKDTASSAGDLDSNLGDANNTAKKLSKTIAGFDELNVLNPKEEGSSGGSGGSSGGSGGAGNIADFKIDETQTEGVKTRLEQFVKDCQEILNKWQSTIPKLEINFDTERAINNLQNIGKNLLNIIAGWGSFIITIGIDIANDLDIGRLANDVLDLFDAFTRLGSSITEAIVPALKTFYRVGLSPLVQAIGDLAHEMMQWITGELSGWADWFDTNKEQINIFAENLGKVVAPLSSIVGLILKVAWTTLSSALTIINDALQGIATSLITMKPETLKSIITDLLLIAGGTLTAKAFFGIQDGLMKFVTGTDQAGNAWKDFKAQIKSGDSKDLVYFITEPFKQAFEKLNMIFFTPFKTALTHLFTPFKSILDAMRVEWTASMTAIGSSGGVLQVLISVVKSLGAGFSALWNILKLHPFALIASAVAVLIAGFINLYNTNEEFRQSINDLWNNTLKPIFQEMLDSIKGLWNEHLKPFFDQVKESCGDLVKTLKGFWDKTLSPLIGVIIKILGVLLSFVLGMFSSIFDKATKIIGGIVDMLKGIIKFIKGLFSADWKMAWDGIKDIFSGFCTAIWNAFKGVFDSIINGVKKAISAVKNLFGFASEDTNITVSADTKTRAKKIGVPTVNAFANGGVITSPTLGLMGEYAGASNNPEIITPQSLLENILTTKNDDVINANAQFVRQIISAIEGIDMEVNIGDETIAKSAQRGNKNYQRRTGISLFAT